MRRIESIADDLENYIGIPRTGWFTDDYLADSEFPGGTYTRTQVLNRTCVFLGRNDRGCMLHKFAELKGIDYHELKPMVSCLFPLTFDDGLLHPAEEVEREALVCLGKGPTLYRGVRNEILYYFGDSLVHELDRLETREHDYVESYVTDNGLSG